jgi:hypothetical protein
MPTLTMPTKDIRSEHLAVAVKKAHQRRPKRLLGTPHLRQRHVERALCGAHPSGLIPITRVRLALPTALMALPSLRTVDPGRECLRRMSRED